MAEAQSLRVLIADDQPLMRSAIRSILEADGMTVVAEAGDGRAAVELCRVEQPDIIVMDVRMPVLDGISATSTLTRQTTPARVLVLTTFDDDETLFGALQAGAAGFMLKNAPPEELQNAVRSIWRGESILDRSVLTRVMRRFAHPAPPVKPDPTTAAATDRAAACSELDATLQLTEREKDVLFLLAAGMSNLEIAAHLHIGDTTAKTHVSHVILKLGVRDRLQAVIHAYSSGFAQRPRTLQTHKDGAETS
jgi:DNA-binding NarL/FixJ family response regulator